MNPSSATIVRRKLPSLSETVSEEDAVQTLVFKLWQRAQRFDGRGSFSGYASRFGDRLLVDIVRQHDGRTKWKWNGKASYERQRPQVTSLDVLRDEGAGLDGALASGTGDPASDCDPFSGWREAARDP